MPFMTDLAVAAPLSFARQTDEVKGIPNAPPQRICESR
jgi:hypothetical protein